MTYFNSMGAIALNSAIMHSIISQDRQQYVKWLLDKQAKGDSRAPVLKALSQQQDKTQQQDQKQSSEETSGFDMNCLAEILNTMFEPK